MRCDIPSTSGRSLETITIAAPRAGQLEHELVDFGLRADVDSARRLVEEKDARVAKQPFREHDLLLRTARKIAHELLGARRLICSSSIIRTVAARSRATSMSRSRSDKVCEVRERNVLAHRHAQNQSLRFAIFGDKRDSGRDCAPMRPACTARPSTETSPRSGRSAPAMARTISVLPAPIRPASPTISPRAPKRSRR